MPDLHCRPADACTAQATVNAVQLRYTLSANTSMLFELSTRIASTVYPLIAIVLAGVLYARKYKPDFRVPNSINMDVFLPALLFSILVGGDFQVQAMGSLAMATAAIIAASGLIALGIARLIGWPLTAFVPPMMFRNSGNVGLPLAVFAFGEQALPAATVVFVVENTLHFTLGARMLNPGAKLLQVLKTPVVWVSLLALAFNFCELPPPTLVMTPLRMLGEVSIPLMVFGLGVRLHNADLREWRIGLGVGIAAPCVGLLCFMIMRPWLDLPPLQMVALLAYAALPPAVLNFMLAEKFRQYPAKMASIVALSHLVALISLPLMLAWALVYIIPHS